jgi:ketosteroid isomerase-like protein
LEAVAEDNVTVVREMFATLAEEGYEALLPLVTPDFELVIPPDMSLEPATYRGPEGFRRYWESFYEVADEVRFEIEDFIAVGDCVVVPTRVIMQGAASGAEGAQRAIQVWRLRDGQVEAVEPYSSLEAAMAAAGKP